MHPQPAHLQSIPRQPIEQRAWPPHPTLRGLLLLDAGSSLLCAALHLLGGAALAAWLGMPLHWLQGSALAVQPYIALAWCLAQRRPRTAWQRQGLRLLVLGNGAWALACLALLAMGGGTLGGRAQAWLLLQAVAVLALALLQARLGLRRLGPAELD